MKKIYSYEKGIAEQVTRLTFNGGTGLRDKTIIDTEAFYHIEPEKMGEELRFIIKPYTQISSTDKKAESYLVLYRYDSPEELFTEMYGSQYNPSGDRLADDDVIADLQFYYNGQPVYGSRFSDVMNFVYRHIADKLMNDEYNRKDNG